jgi:hypothetical protein
MRAAEMSPDDPEIHTSLGEALQQAAKDAVVGGGDGSAAEEKSGEDGPTSLFSKAIHHFELAVGMDPSDSVGWYNLTCVTALAGDSRKCQSALSGALKCAAQIGSFDFFDQCLTLFSLLFFWDWHKSLAIASATFAMYVAPARADQRAKD